MLHFHPADPYACQDSGMWSGSPALPIEAHLQDGRIMRGRARICRDSAAGPMRVTLADTILHPEDTRYLDIEGWKGLPHGNAWTFAVLEGPITAFRMVPDIHAGGFDYLQLGDNPLEPYSDSVLAAYVEGHPGSRGLMARKKWGKVGFIGSVVVAGGLFLAAANLPGREYRDELGSRYRTSYRTNGICVAAGIGALLGGSGFWMATRNNPQQAIRAFNRDAR